MTNDLKISFNIKQLPPSSFEYVLWLDVMATRNTMSVSIAKAANFIFKLHMAVTRATQDFQKFIRLYPVMDGVYITFTDRKKMEDIIKKIFILLANIFCFEKNEIEQFLVRGAIAFGPVYHGAQVSEIPNPISPWNPSYKTAILLGNALTLAYTQEEKAPPFGIYIDETARTFGDDPFKCRWYSWSDPKCFTNKSLFLDKMHKYFAYALLHAHELDYKKDRIKYHQTLFKEYFPDYVIAKVDSKDCGSTGIPTGRHANPFVKKVTRKSKKI